MVWLFSNTLGYEHAKDVVPEVTVLNAALCYFERDASERIARALIRVVPGVTLHQELEDLVEGQLEKESVGAEHVHGQHKV